MLHKYGIGAPKTSASAKQDKKELKMITNTLRVAVIAALLASASANATLEPRLGGKAYYDTNTNLTWYNQDIERRTIGEQVEFVANLVVDGIGGWRIPKYMEFAMFARGYSVCIEALGHCAGFDPLPPLDLHARHFGELNWIDAGAVYPPDPPGDGEGAVYNDIVYYAASGTSMYFSPPYVYSYDTFSVWPVMTGDVALVPEPQTYAMLLAGLGLLGVVRIKWKL